MIIIVMINNYKLKKNKPLSSENKTISAHLEYELVNHKNNIRENA